MQFPTLFLALTASIALAAPLAEPIIATTLSKRADTTLAKRTVHWVYLCNGRNYTGYCVHIPSDTGVCVPLGADLEDQVSSVGPDAPAFCYFWTDRDCKGDMFHVGSPGYPNLSVTPVNGPPGSTRNFEDKLSSYACYN